jgi:hypothetical protein
MSLFTARPSFPTKAFMPRVRRAMSPFDCLSKRLAELPHDLFVPTRIYGSSAVLIAFDHTRRVIAVLRRSDPLTWLEPYERLGWLDAEDRARSGYLLLQITFRRPPGDRRPRLLSLDLDLGTHEAVQHFIADWPTGHTLQVAQAVVVPPFF